MFRTRVSPPWQKPGPDAILRPQHAQDMVLCALLNDGQPGIVRVNDIVKNYVRENFGRHAIDGTFREAGRTGLCVRRTNTDPAIEIRFPNTSNYPANCTDPFTVIALVRRDTTTASKAFIGRGMQTDSNGGWTIGLGATAGGTFATTLGSDALSNTGQVADSGLAVNVGEWTVLGLSQISNTRRVFATWNFAQLQTVTNTATHTAGVIERNGSWFVGQHYVNTAVTEPWEGAIEFVFVWKRGMVQPELVELMQRPYQVFRRQSDLTLFLPPRAASAVANTQNLAGSSTSTGALVKADAKPAAGSCTATGALAKLFTKSLGGSVTSSGSLAKARKVTVTVNSTTGDGSVLSYTFSGVYETARAGTDSLTTNTHLLVGQTQDNSITYWDCYQSFLNFNLTGIGIPALTVFTSATLSLYLEADGSTTNFNVEARTSNWGSSVDTADFVAGASLSGLTLLASVGTGSLIGAYNPFTESGTALRDASATALAGDGIVRMLLDSDNQANDSPPTLDENVIFESTTSASGHPPRLTLSYYLQVADAQTQSASGSVTPSGALVKATTKHPAGSVTSSGAMVKAGAKTLNGSCTATGANTYTKGKALAGSVTSSGTLSRTVLKALAGSVTASAAVVKAVAKAFAGSSTCSGSPAKASAKALSGAVTATGATAKADAKTLAGSMTASGAIAKAESKSLAGATTATGSLVKSTNKNLAGTVTPTGTITSLRGKSFAGSVTSTGALAKADLKALAGTTTTSGAIAKAAAKSAAGSSTSSGTCVRSATKPLVGFVTGVGTLVRAVTKALAGASTATGATIKAVAKTFAGSTTATGDATETAVTVVNCGGSVTGSGTLVRAAAKHLSGSVTASGAAVKMITKGCAGSSTSSGTARKTDAKALSGSTSASGTIVKAAAKPLSGSVSSTGSVTKADLKSLVGTITSSGTPRKATTKSAAGSVTATGTESNLTPHLQTLGGSVTASGTATRATTKPLTSNTTASGAIAKAASKGLSGSESPGGTAAKAVSKTATGSATPSGTLRKAAAKSPSGSVSVSGAATKACFKTATSTVTPTGTEVRGTYKNLAGSGTPTGALLYGQGRRVGGTVTASGALARRLSALRSLSGSCVTAGSLRKDVSQDLVGSLVPEGTAAVGKVYTQTTNGSVAPFGDLSNAIVQLSRGPIFRSNMFRRDSSIFRGSTLPRV